MKLPEQGRGVPGLRDVAVKRGDLYLSQHNDLGGIHHDIRQRKIDQTEMIPPNVNGRLRKAASDAYPHRSARTIARTWFFAIRHLFRYRETTQSRCGHTVLQMYRLRLIVSLRFRSP